MKIAVTYENGQVFQHFGHCEQFKLYDAADGAVTSSQVVSAAGSGHGALAGFLQSHGVDALICGGIGAGARTALAEAGIQLYPGVSGGAPPEPRGGRPDLRRHRRRGPHRPGGGRHPALPRRIRRGGRERGGPAEWDALLRPGHPVRPPPRGGSPVARTSTAAPETSKQNKRGPRRNNRRGSPVFIESRIRNRKWSHRPERPPLGSAPPPPGPQRSRFSSAPPAAPPGR